MTDQGTAGVDVVDVDIKPPVWEPATLVLSCRRGHTWASRGRYHAPSCTGAADRPTCPRLACGLPWVSMEIYTGPRRPHVIDGAR